MAPLYSGHCSLFTTLSTGTFSTSIFSGTGVQATVPYVYYGGSWFLSIFLTSCGCFLCCNGAVLCLLSHLLLVVCPLCHHYFFNRMSTTYCTVVLLYYHYLCCCVASCYKYCFFFLFGALCTYLSWFCPLYCCIAYATASLFPSVPEQLPPARKCQQHEMHPPRNRRMINMYRRV